MHKIELLSPAKNIECGIEAINHGADAVYIGAPKFSARAAAGNSVSDIEHLASYAHMFNARVYVALNTILKDEEMEDANAAIWEIYNAGADAVIIQDMGLLETNLPPIALHASTQTDNRTPDKVKFLEDTGFSQVVLARELTLAQIKEITSQVNIPVEVFIHGALCVSYSGQCYMSQAVGGRSANRGECAQYCRLPYDLVDAGNAVIVKNKHLLSLKDMNLSDHLSGLIGAGVSSFKIEGRLKDVAYVKNTTAFYRQKLDAILEQGEHKKSSSGKTTFFFTPDLKKSFHRGGGCTYFLNGRSHDITSFETPKSTGEFIGKIHSIGRNYITVNSPHTFHNGDGLCFLDKKGEFQGFRINKVEGNRLFPAQMPAIDKDTILYRNMDQAFTQELLKKSADRKIGISILFSETREGFRIKVTDEDGCCFEQDFTAQKELAKNAEQATKNIINQLSKLGNTIFYIQQFNLDVSGAFFIPNSQLAEWKRIMTEGLEMGRKRDYTYVRKEFVPTSHPYPVKNLSYLGNVYNVKAREFYLRHGVENIEPAFEKKEVKDVPLMFAKHCIKYSLGYCKKHPAYKGKIPFHEPLFLRHKNDLFRLDFDCQKCEMHVTKKMM